MSDAEEETAPMNGGEATTVMPTEEVSVPTEEKSAPEEEAIESRKRTLSDAEISNSSGGEFIDSDEEDGESTGPKAEDADDEEEGDREEEEEEEENQGDVNEYLVDGEMEGFMAGEEDADQEDVRSKKKKVKRKRLRKNTDKVVLDEEDLLLVGEQNEDMDQVGEEDGHRSPQHVADDGEDAREADEIAPELDNANNEASMSKQFADDIGDDMDDFIVDEMSGDEGDKEDGGVETGQIVPLERVPEQRRAMSRFAEGPRPEEIQESLDIFGIEDLGELNMDDLEEEDEDHYGMDEEKEGSGKKDMPAAMGAVRDKIERQVLVDNFFTANDEKIRAIDYPERYFGITHGRGAITDDERSTEANWISSELLLKMQQRLGQQNNILSSIELKPCVENILKFIQEERLEVPFIWAYRADYLIDGLTRDDLWYIVRMDVKWEAIYGTQTRILREVEAIVDFGDYDPSTAAQKQEEVESTIHELSLQKDTFNVNMLELTRKRDRALDDIDRADADDDEVITKNKEIVSSTETEMDALRERMEIVEASIYRYQDDIEEMHRKGKYLQQYGIDGVKDVMDLFPKERFLKLISECHDEPQLRDIHLYLQLLLRGAEKVKTGDGEERDEDGMVIQKEGDQNNLDTPANARKTLTSSSKILKYRKCRQVSALRDLLKSIAMSASDIGDALRGDFPPQIPSVSQDEYDRMCLACLDEVDMRDRSKVEEALVTLYATELGAEPMIKLVSRETYRLFTTVRTRPTKKGLTEINPVHEYFGIHYLDNKPVGDFFLSRSDKAMFAVILKAEKQGLLTVEFSTPSKLTAEQIRAELTSQESSISKIFGMVLPYISASDVVDADSFDTLNEVRMKALVVCIRDHMLEYLSRETRREMIRECKENVIEEAAKNFEKMLSVGPFRPPYYDARDDIKAWLEACPRKPFYGKVLSVNISPASHQPIAMAIVDDIGTVITSNIVPSKLSHKKGETLIGLMKQYKPELIIFNSSGGRVSKSTRDLAERAIADITESMREETKKGKNLLKANGEEDEQNEYKATALIVKDEISEIFRRSVRSKKMFPDLPDCLRAAVCLARFTQEPLAEYCNLWSSANSKGDFGSEVLFLKLHQNLDLVKTNRDVLLQALECKLVDAVCEAGVDVNAAIAYDHLYNMLNFVGGLGYRKADQLRSQIKEKLGHVTSRAQLLEKRILKKNVWTNAVGFFKVEHLNDPNATLNPLDNTRIHPECYYVNTWAQKICADALEREQYAENDDYIDLIEQQQIGSRNALKKKLAKSKAYLDLWKRGRPQIGKNGTTYKETIQGKDGYREKEYEAEINDAMSLLLLDDYCADLEKQGFGKREKQFNALKEEIRFPWLDMRRPLLAPSQGEMFTILTGESDDSLYVGMKTGVTISRIEDKQISDGLDGTRRVQSCMVNTDCGLRGQIPFYECSDDHIDPETYNLKERLFPGDRMVAVVIKVDKIRNSLDLSIKPSIVKSSESWWIASRKENRFMRRWIEEVANRGTAENYFPPYFLEEIALKAYDDQLSLETKVDMVESKNEGDGESGGPPRVTIKQRLYSHPLFHNISHRDAEERLKSGQLSHDVVIRPSSQGGLTITWLFQPNWVMHFQVTEKGMLEGNLGIGDELYIQYGLETQKTEPYSDLDEIYARFIDPMTDYVNLMVSHRYFKEGGVEDVEQYMWDQLNEEPGKTPFCMRFEPDHPGTFILTWIQNPTSNNPIRKAKIQVLENGYYMEKRIFSRPGEIVAFFKEKFSKANGTGQSNLGKPVQGSHAPPVASMQPARRSRFTDN